MRVRSPSDGTTRTYAVHRWSKLVLLTGRVRGRTRVLFNNQDTLLEEIGKGGDTIFLGNEHGSQYVVFSYKHEKPVTVVNNNQMLLGICFSDDYLISGRFVNQ